MSRGLVSGGLPLIEVEKLVDVKQREAEVGEVLAGGAGQFARGGKFGGRGRPVEGVFVTANNLFIC